MKLFHGTNADFADISLAASKNHRDFGKGFYTTILRKQAVEWAELQCVRAIPKTNIAYLYEYDCENFDDLAVQRFEGYTKEWLHFVVLNRKKGGLHHSFDIVIGPVANDNTTTTINDFLDGVYTDEEALQRLSYMKANNQVSFHTEKSLSKIAFVGRTQWNT
jgi:hypothetical protein